MLRSFKYTLIQNISNDKSLALPRKVSLISNIEANIKDHVCSKILERQFNQILEYKPWFAIE